MKSAAEKGAAALKPWRSAGEVEAAEAGTSADKGMNWGSRQRFVDWYAWLHANFAIAASKGKLLGRRLLGELVTIVTPDRLLHWHRVLPRS